MVAWYCDFVSFLYVVLEVVVSVLTETLLWLIVSATVVAAFGIYWHTFMK